MTTLETCWSKIGVWGNCLCPELKKVVHCRNCSVYSTAASVSLDRDSGSGDEAEWSAYYAAAPRPKPEESPSVGVVFRLGTEWFALPASIFKEVAASRPIHSLPRRTDPVILGVVNIRGELVVAVSLHHALAVEQPLITNNRQTIPGRFLVIAKQKNRFVFPADEVHGLLSYEARHLQKPPGTLARSARAVSKGILRWETRAVACLDENSLFQLLRKHVA
jgi:chemotaxis-related protein WspD